jgi:hypothetical protein
MRRISRPENLEQQIEDDYGGGNEQEQWQRHRGTSSPKASWILMASFLPNFQCVNFLKLGRVECLKGLKGLNGGMRAKGL